MKENMIENYYIDGNGQVNVIMNQSTARDIYYAVKGFEDGQAEANAYSMKAKVGQFIAINFLYDKKVRQYLNTSEKGMSRGRKYEIFEKAVRKKIQELLGIKEKTTP